MLHVHVPKRGKIKTAMVSKWVKSTPEQRVPEVAKSSLRSRLRQVSHYLEAVASKSSPPEHLHQLRVWSRRAQSALHLYSEVLVPRRAAWVEKQLKKLRKATNEARDLDVFASRLVQEPESAVTRQLLELIAVARVDARAPLRKLRKELARDDRFHRRVAKLIERIDKKSHKRRLTKVRLKDWGRARLRAVADELLAGFEADLSDVNALHELRIRGKRLRYAIELLGRGVGPKLRKELYPQVLKLQEVLGRLNDHAVAGDMLQQWLARVTDPAVRDYLQQGIDREAVELQVAQADFAAWWTDDKKLEFRDLIERLLG